MRGINRLAAHRGVFRVGQAFHRHVNEIRIAQKGGAVGERPAHCFRDPVDGLSVVPALELDGIENIQRLDHGDAAGAWRRAGDDFPLRAFDSLVHRLR